MHVLNIRYFTTTIKRRPFFFDDYDPGTAKALRKGLEQIKDAHNYFTKFIANSPYTIKQQISRRELDQVNWSWLPPLITDGIHFKVDVKSNKKYSLCAIGRIVPHKMLHQAIRLFECYKNFDPSASMAIIGSGSGDYYKYCKKLIDKNKGIDHYSEISEQDRQSILSDSKALINLSAHEGFSLPIVEAVSMGCIPFYGTSIWLDMMLGLDELQIGLDGDLEYASYCLYNILNNHSKLKSLYSKASKRIDKLTAFMTPQFQFQQLINP